MKQLSFIFILAAFLICAGCNPQTDGNIKAAQGSAEKFHNNIDNTNNVNNINSSSNDINNRSKPDNVTTAGKAQSNVPSTAKENSAATLKESSDAKTKEHKTQVTLWVTRDFGEKELCAQKVSLEQGASVMDVLKKNLSVETRYGGGFVESINGLASGYTGADKKTRDWFYYVNGIITSVGALDYKPTPGEIIWWDYHDWGTSAFTPALIGAFPEPFRSGYRGINPGTVVLVAAGCEQQGEKLAACLKNLGVKQIEVKPYSEDLLSEDKKIVIVIGLWNQFQDDNYWQGLQKQRKKTGLFVELSPEYFAALDDKGTEVQKYQENVGAIVATGAGMGDQTPVWLMTGLDTTGLDDAVNILIKNPRAIKQHFGALVAGGKVIAVPVAD